MREAANVLTKIRKKRTLEICIYVVSISPRLPLSMSKMISKMLQNRKQYMKQLKLKNAQHQKNVGG